MTRRHRQPSPRHHRRLHAVAALSAALLTVTGAFSFVTDAGASETEPSPVWLASAPQLGVGSTGAAVVEWQAAMNLWLDVAAPNDPFRLADDGTYERLTDSVTRRFQYSQGLPVDGIVGPVTRAAFLSAPELVAAGRSPAPHQPFLEPGDQGDAIATWQRDLNRWSVAVGAAFGQVAVDGVYGPATEQATREFQQRQGITVDGLAGPETRAALASAPALVNVSPVDVSSLPAATTAPSPSAFDQSPAAGICSTDDAPIVEIVLAMDGPSPRCVKMSGDHWLRLVNNGPATVVVLGALHLDLGASETVVSPLPVGAYVGSGVHTLEIERYDGSGPDVWTQ